jgi:hypothetical protein
VFNLGVVEYALNGFKRAACGDANLAEFVVLLACPLGPIPLAARGLAAVLARVGPSGAGSTNAPAAAGEVDGEFEVGVAVDELGGQASS